MNTDKETNEANIEFQISLLKQSINQLETDIIDYVKTIQKRVTKLEKNERSNCDSLWRRPGSGNKYSN